MPRNALSATPRLRKITRTRKNPRRPTLQCPFCGGIGNQNLVDCAYVTQPTIDKHGFKRRRKCLYCGQRYTTYEIFLMKTKLYVRKRNGKRQTYSRDKLATSIRKAYGKRTITHERLERVLNNIERQCDLAYHENEKREVQSVHIGQLVLNSLKELDEVAYIRYASIFHDFYSAEHFLKAAEMLAGFSLTKSTTESTEANPTTNGSGANDPPREPDRT